MAPARTRPTAALRVALPAVLAVLLAAPARAQEGDPDALADAALAALDDALDDHDLTAVQDALVDLDLVYDAVAPRTRSRVLRALDRVLSTEARKEVRADGSDPAEELLSCYELTVGLLYDKDEGGDLLLKALKRKHVRDWPAVAAHIVEGLGYRVDPKLVDVFTGHLLGDPLVASAAAGALGRYGESPFALRRQAATALAKAYLERHRAAEKEKRKGKDDTAQQDLLLVQGAFGRALETLTRQQLGDPESWEAWISANAHEGAW